MGDQSTGRDTEEVVSVSAQPSACGPSRTSELLNAAMLMLARQPRALFIGQCVAYDGVSMYHDLAGVPAEQRVEFPVAEELQMGYGIGLAMMGYLPILQYPRMDFLLRAADQLVNHLDKIEEMSRGQWNPKVIIRTRVGAKSPLNAGPQHTQDHTFAFLSMLTNVDVARITEPEHILPAYTAAIESKRSSLVVEVL